MSGRSDDGDRAPGTPILERIVGALGVLMLLGTCAALGWEVLWREGGPPDFRLEVLETIPLAGRHLVRFRVINTGRRAAEEIAVTGSLEGERPETARIVLDFLAPGEEREGGLLFSADPAGRSPTLTVESFADP
jgi:uncharacterized protein (TIGR02588 family)